MANEQTGAVALLRRIRANLTDPDLIAEVDERLTLVDAVKFQHRAARLGRYALHIYEHGWPTYTSWSFDIEIADRNVCGPSFASREAAEAAAIEAVLDWRIE